MVRRFIVWVFLAVLVSVAFANAQNLPDAPTPQGNVPKPRPAPTVEAPDPNSADPQGADPQQNAPQQSDSQKNDSAQQPAVNEQPPQPSPEVKTVPRGTAPQASGSDRDKLFTLVKPVNFVLVPVTVKDGSGHLVPSLGREYFKVYENGKLQKINFFSIDPFPISAAILIDVGMADIALKKVAETFPALVGAFSNFDEVAVYSFGNTVKKQQDYLAAQSEKITAALRNSGAIQGRGSGPMVLNPMTAGPSVNGLPADPANPISPTTSRPHEPSRVLNDAVLRAALDLGKRDRTRRKIIFVVSDGREDGSTASYADVLKVLLSNEVSLYAVAVDQGAIPVYEKLSKIRIPGQGYGNILPKYATATGGEVFPELTRAAIEQTYALITEQARNQYTIGYNAAVATSGTYRSIDVHVVMPGLKVRARDGYYPLPPSPQQTQEAPKP